MRFTNVNILILLEATIYFNKNNNLNHYVTKKSLHFW